MEPTGLTRGELISALSAVLLLGLMFAVAWYGVDGIPGRPDSRGGAAGAETAWQGLSVVRWLMLLTVILAFATLAVHAGRPARQVVAAVRLALLGVATIDAVVVVIRVLIDLPSPQRIVDQKLGAVLGVVAALGIAFGAYDAVREQRVRMLAVSQFSARTAR